MASSSSSFRPIDALANAASSVSKKDSDSCYSSDSSCSLFSSSDSSDDAEFPKRQEANCENSKKSRRNLPKEQRRTVILAEKERRKKIKAAREQEKACEREHIERWNNPQRENSERERNAEDAKQYSKKYELFKNLKRFSCAYVKAIRKNNKFAYDDPMLTDYQKTICKEVSKGYIPYKQLGGRQHYINRMNALRHLAGFLPSQESNGSKRAPNPKRNATPSKALREKSKRRNTKPQTTDDDVAVAENRRIKSFLDLMFEKPVWKFDLSEFAPTDWDNQFKESLFGVFCDHTIHYFACLSAVYTMDEIEISESSLYIGLKRRPVLASCLNRNETAKLLYRIFRHSIGANLSSCASSAEIMTKLMADFNKMLCKPIRFHYEGSTENAYVADTLTRGKGLFAKKCLKKNTVIANYAEPPHKYIMGTQENATILMIGGKKANLVSVLVDGMEHYEMELEHSEKNFDKLWDAFVRNRDSIYRTIKKNEETKELTRALLFSSEFQMFLNHYLLAKAFPDHFTVPVVPFSQCFSGPFWEVWLFSDIGFRRLIETLGAVVVPCEIRDAVLVSPSLKGIANFCNQPNADETINAKFVKGSDGSIQLQTTQRVVEGTEILMKYVVAHGKRFEAMPKEDSIQSICNNLRLSDEATRDSHRYLLDLLKNSGLFPSKSELFARLEAAAAQADTGTVAEPVVEAALEMQDRLILVYDKAEWWPCLVTSCLQHGRYRLLCLRDDLSVDHLLYFGRLWQKPIPLGKNISDFMIESPRTLNDAVELINTEGLHESFPWCDLRTATDDISASPSQGKIPTHVSAKSVRDFLKANYNHFLELCKSIKSSCEEESLSLKEQMRHCYKVLSKSRINLNAVLSLEADAIETSFNLEFFDTLTEVCEQVPYYYNDEGTWLQVNSLDIRPECIRLNTETLSGEKIKGFVKYKAMDAFFLSEFHRLLDRGEIVLYGDRQPLDLYKITSAAASTSSGASTSAAASTSAGASKRKRDDLNEYEKEKKRRKVEYNKKYYTKNKKRVLGDQRAKSRTVEQKSLKRLYYQRNRAKRLAYQKKYEAEKRRRKNRE